MAPTIDQRVETETTTLVDLIPKHRYLGWASGALLALTVLGANRDNMTLAGVGGARVAVSLLARFLIERRLKRT